LHTKYQKRSNKSVDTILRSSRRRVEGLTKLGENDDISYHNATTGDLSDQPRRGKRHRGDDGSNDGTLNSKTKRGYNRKQ